jgi:hypothetical protein
MQQSKSFQAHRGMPHSGVKKDRTAPLSIQLDKGKFAFKKGWLGNPYKPDTVQGKEWQRGFDAAYFEHVDKLTKRS